MTRNNAREEEKEDNDYTEECDTGMGLRDEVVGELGEGPSEEIGATVS